MCRDSCSSRSGWGFDGQFESLGRVVERSWKELGRILEGSGHWQVRGEEVVRVEIVRLEGDRGLEVMVYELCTMKQGGVVYIDHEKGGYQKRPDKNR